MNLINSLGIALVAASVAGAAEPSSVHDLTVKDAEGNDLALSKYDGKVLLIVNVASKCGFTKQYAGLQKLYEEYGDRGLVILGFPCNQFGGQEPGTNEQIQTFCNTEYGVTFPVLAKLDVNGQDAHPLYTFLKDEASGALGTKAIKWNFTKFLVDRDGKVINRFGSSTKPEDLRKDIEAILDRKEE